MDRLWSIGEFARHSGLSQKMLRNYAAAGLLVPTAVDRFSGYRYYSPSQLDRARLVAALRRARVPVAEIAAFIASPSAADLDRFEAELERTIAERRAALDVARACLEDVARTAARRRRHEATEGRATMTRTTMASASEKGPVRESNQDATLVGDRLAAVADGMGGRGGIAADLALSTLSAQYVSDAGPESLGRACEAANEAIWVRAADDETLAGIGTTLAALAVASVDGREVLALAHVGDSRVYRWRSGELRALTIDHSLVAELVAAGELSEHEARSHPQRSILTRALGIAPSVEVEWVELDHEPGDRYLLCTDGLVNEIDEGAICALLEASRETQAAADALVRAALRAGGHDNVSAVVVDVA